VEQGRSLVAGARCSNCHAASPHYALDRPTPSLEDIGARTSANWIHAALGRHTIVTQTATQTADLTAFLAARRPASPIAVKPRKANEVAVGKGGELFGTMGCVFCHPSGSLPAMGSKYSLAVLTARLLDGHQPSMMLNDEDATAIAAYLTRSTDPAFERPAPAGDATRGAQAFDSLGCASCHQQSRNAKPLASLRSDSCRVVRTSWTAPERQAVQAFVLEHAKARTPAPVFSYRFQLDRFQCFACHKAGTEAPPLEGVGEKLKTAWIGQVLWGRQRIRPSREIRMPHYSQAALQPLLASFAKVEGLAPGDGAPPPAMTAQMRETGLGMLGTNPRKQGMGCIGCHDWGEFKSLGEEGPQLREAASRMRFEWFERWMRNPGRILSGTSMPNYFGTMPVERARPRIHSLWAAMDAAAKSSVPDGYRTSDLEVTSEAKPVVGDKNAVVLRWDMPEATPAAIAVGLPGGLSYCFDAGESRLLYAWRGGFLDLTGTLLRKTDKNKLTPTAALVGETFWRAAKDYPIQVGADRRIPQRRFRGYRLIKGIPEFHYQLDGSLHVYETLQPLPEKKAIRRTLRFDAVSGPVYFNGKPVAEGRNVQVEEILE
jgi:cytochrome c2